MMLSDSPRYVSGKKKRKKALKTADEELSFFGEKE
jgi:hypothetical protein